MRLGSLVACRRPGEVDIVTSPTAAWRMGKCEKKDLHLATLGVTEGQENVGRSHRLGAHVWMYSTLLYVDKWRCPWTQTKKIRKWLGQGL